MIAVTADPQLLGMYSGRVVYPLALKLEDVAIEDIARALSMQCRFGGHTSRFYSVAEHSVNVMKAVPDVFKLEALLHDASEAYLVDLPRPIKNAPGFEMYKLYEEAAMGVIEAVFGYDSTKESRAAVTLADNRILATEMRDLTKWGPEAYPADPYGDITIVGMGPVTAEKYFLAHYNNLVG